MLDVIGDLRLLGCRIEGQIIAHKSGHNLNAELVRAMLAALDKNDPTAAQTDTAPALIASKHA